MKKKVQSTQAVGWSKTIAFCLFLMLGLATSVKAQLTGTKTIPGDYTDLASAIADLNTNGVGAGGAVINIAAGYTETAPAGGFALGSATLNASLSSSNTLVIQKSGVGANPLLTAYTAGTGTPGTAVQDGIFRLVGADYVTIDGIDLTENAANTTNPSTMEYGYAMYKLSATDGCQNNTIQNCTITLSNVNNAAGTSPSVDGSRGIDVVNALATAATTGLTVTAVSGTNSNNKFYANTIQNCNIGISLFGFAASSPFTLGDTGNDIGGASMANGNTIRNYGGASAAANPAAGIRINNQWGCNISYNSIDNNNGSGTNHPSTLRGIYAQTATSANITITNNTVSVKGGATSSAVLAIDNGVGGTAASNTVTITGNTIQNCAYSTGTTGSVTYINNTATPALLNISNNTIQNNTYNGAVTSGTITCIASTSTGVINISNNTINNINTASTGTCIGIATGSPTGAGCTVANNSITNIVRTGASGTQRGITMTSPTNNIVFNANTIDGISFTNTASSGSIDGIYGLSSATNITLTNNIVRNLSIPGTGTINGIREFGSAGIKFFQNNMIYNFSTVAGGAGGSTFNGISLSTGTVTVSGNQIYALNSTGTNGTTVNGILVSGGGSSTISKNKIYDLSSTGASPVISGINMTGSTTQTISNNFIGQLGVTNATASNAVMGINITGGTTSNVYYNTVYINTTSSASGFGSSAVSSNNTPVITLRNNIFINKSVATGTALTAAYRRSTTTLTNYSTNSNNNAWYAGTPSAASVIFYDGTNSYQTILAFKAAVSTRETASVTEDVNFVSTTGSSSSFLHVNTATQSYTESGAVNIAGITDDFDADIRQGNAGYAGTGTAPDIGADEFNGTPYPQCSGTPVTPTITGVTALCSGTGTTLSLAGTSTDLGLTYQWASATTAGGPYTNMGTSVSQTTGNLTATTYYIATTTCTNGGATSTTAEYTVTVNSLPTVTVTPTAAQFCNPGGTPVALTAGGATTYSWSPSAGLSATSGASVNASPTANTTYTVTGTDGNGCTGTASSTITVNLAPATPTVTATPAAVCNGANSSLLAAGGFPSFTYCTSTHTSGCSGDNIANVVLGSISNNTGTACGGGSHYTYFTPSATTTTTLTPAGGTYSLTVTFGTDGNQYFGAWIDYNQDGTFAATEFLGASANAGSSGTTTVTFTVPAGAFNGTTKLRIIGGNDAAVTATQACGASSSPWGETQDYDVTISGATDVFTYSWAPSTYLSSTTVANPTATAITSSIVYTVTTTSPAGCATSNTVAISSGAALSGVASVTPSNTVCANSNITLNTTPTGGGAPYTYAWTGPNSFTSTSQSPAITAVTVAEAGTYSVTITDNCGANVVATVSLTVNALPVVAVTPTNGAVCNPGGTAVALAASGATTYSWTPSTGLSATSGANVNALPSASTIYTVTGTDANNCSSTATATVGVGPNPVISSVTATPNAVCNGGNSVLSAAAGFPAFTYCASTHANGCSGDNIAGVTLGSINNTTGTTCGGTTHYTDVAPSATTTTTLTPSGGTYTVSVSFGTDGNQYFGAWIDYDQDGTFAAAEFLGASANAGSSGTISVNFTVPAFAYNGITKIRIIGGNDSPVAATEACGASSSGWGETQDYVVTITGGVDPFSYSWSPSTYLSSTTVSNPSASAIMSSITYTATVTSGIGCVVTDSVAISAGTPLTSAANATPANTVCAGTNTTLHAVPTGGGGPYTFAWTGPNGFTSTAQDTALNAITVAQAGTYSVTITDNCGANSMASFALTVNTNPVVSVNTTAASICLPGGSAVPITASGATTYAWAPSSGLSATTGASVTANPGATTTYTVTGTDGNGCIGTATSTISVGANPSFVSVTATPSTVCTGGASQLMATATISAPVSISEVTLFRGGTGSGVYPAYVAGQDLVELSNNLSTTIDISGYTLSAFGNNSATASHTITFPVGTTIPAGAVLVVHIGTGTNDVANRYYNTGGTTDSYFSSSQMGVVLYNGTAVVDAVGMGAGTGYTFNAATGITALDFSGYAPNIGGNAGVIRTATIDSNTGSDWVASTGVLQQTIGVFNMVYSAPGSVNYVWTPAASLSDDSIANPIATPAASTVYSVTAISSIGCTNTTGTVSVTASPLTAVNVASAPSTPICVGASVVLSSTPTGGGPYTYSWMPGGATTASYTVTPSATTVYTLTVMNSCGDSVNNTITVNVNQLPTITATAPGTLYCNPGTAVTLTAGGASTYSWAPSAGLDVTNSATPNATPTVTTTYTVTGTDVNGCVNTTTIAITSAPTPTVTAMATPSTPVCAGTPVQLGSTAVIPMTYVQSVSGFNPESCAATAGPTGDDVVQGPNAIGFNFTYYGVTYTQFGISTNGNIQLGNGSGSANNPTYSNAWTDVAIPNTATPNNMVALAWDDWLISAGEIKWGVTGTSPNQKLVICYATTGRGGGSADTLQGQIVLEETTNNVILNVIKKGIQPSNTSTQGIEDATGSNASMAVSGRNNQAWSANFETRIFSPYTGTFTYNWSPAADLDTATIATPIARLQTSTTFTFTATEASGCSANATVAVTVNPLPVVALGVDTAICSAGTPITLDAGNAGSMYTWSTTETTQSIAVDTTGSYNVSVTDVNGCIGADTISVTVNASPVVSLGIDTVRCGGSVTLDAGNVGSTYAWSDATNGQTNTIATTGVYDVVVTTPQGCAGYDTVMVTINTIPTVNIGNDTLFCGSNLTLDAGNAGSSYFWNTTEATQTINVSTTGQYFVEVTTPQNCSSRDTINVTIAPAITVNLGNDSLVCSSTSVILDGQNPGSTYLWSDSTTSSTLIVSAPGTYSVLVTSPDGCVAQDTIVFTDNSPVVDLTLPFSITCVTSSVNALSGGSPVGGFYSGTGVTGTNFNAATAGVGNFLITYSYTDGTTGCFATDTQTVVVDPCVGIKELSTVASIVIAPNPTTGYFSINMPSRDNVLKAEMYTVEGQLISSETYKGREVYEVNITQLANAVYYLRLTVDGETNVVKIVKQQ